MSAVVSIVRRTCYSSSRTPLRLSCSADKKYRTKTVPVFRACYARHASSSNPYPYPNNLNPTPHQIFHLPKGASRADVKARYYDLVRIYHPDSPVNHSVPPHIAQSRFHAISAAYDVLRGRPTSHPFSGDGELERKRNDFHDLSTAMWKAKQRKRAEALTFGSGLDDKWKDRFMFGLIFLTIAAFVAQTYTTRMQAIASASQKSHSDPNSNPSSYRNGISRPPFKSSPTRHSSLEAVPPPHEPALAQIPSEPSSSSPGQPEHQSVEGKSS